VLVTGATGFIGSALIDRLAADARRDPSAPAVRAAVRDPHTVERRWPAAVKIVSIGDLAASPRWSDALDGVTCVIHSAGLAHVAPHDAARADQRFQSVNVDASVALADAVAAAGVRRLVFVSSIKVHGEQTAPGRPFRAADAPVDPRQTDAYGRSKVAAESALRDAARRDGFELVIVRPPLVYGPGARANFGALLRTVAAGWPLPLASVRNTRSLVSLENLVDFLVVASRHPSAAGQTLLVSDGEDLSTPELIRRMARALGRPARLVPIPVWVLRLAGQMLGRGTAMERLLGSLQVESAPCHALLDWTPPRTLDEGLRAAAASVAPSQPQHVTSA
jgi:nucleoside-diphosphate-sugar epimerase